MKKLLIIIVTTSLLILLIASSVRFEKDSDNILIDMAKPHKILWPCEIDYVGENGERGFRIGPNVEQGWRTRGWDSGEDNENGVEAKGYATYNFYIPQDGEYTLWGYVLWDDACTDAVYVQIDQGKTAILGNNPIYKEWHWVKGFTKHLMKGSHTLTLSNHSNNIAIQKIMLIGSKYKTPSESQAYITDIFYDDFDGCDLGNFQQWNKISGNWNVIADSKPACDNSNSLVGESFAEEDSEIRIGDDQWENYSFDINYSIKEWHQGALASLKFGINNANDYMALKFTPLNSSVDIILVRYQEGQEHVLGKSNIKSKNFKISALADDGFRILVNDKPAIKAESQTYRGGIALTLSGEIKVHFDDIHVRYQTDTNEL